MVETSKHTEKKHKIGHRLYIVESFYNDERVRVEIKKDGGAFHKDKKIQLNKSQIEDVIETLQEIKEDMEEEQ